MTTSPLAGQDPEHDHGDLNRGRPAVAYVLPSPTGKPLRWRTYFALPAARSEAGPPDWVAGALETPGIGPR